MKTVKTTRKLVREAYASYYKIGQLTQSEKALQLAAKAYNRLQRRIDLLT